MRVSDNSARVFGKFWDKQQAMIFTHCVKNCHLSLVNVFIVLHDLMLALLQSTGGAINMIHGGESTTFFVVKGFILSFNCFSLILDLSNLIFYTDQE